GTAICNTLITVSMISYLSSSRTGFRTTNILLVKLIHITVETGFITTTFAIIELVLFLHFKEVNVTS
ncbi:hypothetical protein M422DRAFT_196394, partial [Sphaerobolus stellatus SS14]